MTEKREYDAAVEALRKAMCALPAPSAEPQLDAREAMRLALSLIEQGEGEPEWVAYATCVDQARNVLRAALGEDK